jgi:hypothetical protein
MKCSEIQFCSKSFGFKSIADFGVEAEDAELMMSVQIFPNLKNSEI